MGKKYSQIKVGTIITYLTIGFSIASGLLYTPWMIRQIGQADYGMYTLVMSLINLFLVDFGIGSSISRFVAKYRVEDNKDELAHFLLIVYKVYILIDIIIICVLGLVFVNLENIYSSFTLEEIAKLKILFGCVGLYSVISFPCMTFNGILTAYEEFIPLKIADAIQKIGAICLTVIALFCGLGLYALVFSNIVSGMLACLVKFYYVKKNVKVSVKQVNRKKTTKALCFELFGFSLWAMIIGLAQRLIFSITPSILGIVAKSAIEAIAVFGIVTTLEGYVYTITTAVNGMFMTRITNLIQNDPNGDKMTKLAIRVGKFQFVLNGIIIVGFVLVGKEFIIMWMGNEFAQAYYCLLLVIIPGLFYNSLQIAHTAMIAQNLLKYQAYIQIIIGVINVILSLGLSRKYGVVGACVSIFIAYMIRVFLNLFIIRKKINIDLKRYLKECYLQMSIILILTGGISGMIVSKITMLSWLGIVYKGIIIILVYVFFLGVIVLSKEERAQIKNKIIQGGRVKN